jgi:hypothetical protein
MRFSTTRLEFSLAAIGAVLLAATANGGRPSVPLPQDVAGALSGPVRAGEHVVVPRMTLDDGTTVSLDLEAFEVFAPDAAIIAFTDKGPRRLSPPTDRYFRGTVIGDLDSAVVLVAGAKLRGFVFTKGQTYAIAPERDVYGDDLPDPLSRIRRIDPERDRPADLPPFRCDTDSLPVPPESGMSATALGAPMTVEPLWTSTVYTINLAIETDYELYHVKCADSTDRELRFIGDLTAAASVIYWRDVKTVFKIGTVHLWTTSSDPWTASTTSTALQELLTYWNTNYTGVTRTIVHMLSGKDMGGGIAYLGVLCYASYGYGLSSSLSTTFSVTIPNQYWTILCYTHEMGHNFSSPHTHCYSPPVDHCYNESGCYSGTLCVNGTNDPCNSGTIMSYCHLRSGGYSNINMYFGNNSLTVPAGCQSSQAVLDQMRGYIESRASCLGLLAAAPTVTGISPTSGSTGGGTPVTISGTGFQSYATVTIGGVNATAVTIVNATTITATTGAHAAGTVSVVVQNPDSQTATKTNAYTYGTPPAPVVTSINPGFGPTTGGTSVTIGGSNFVNGATVSLGGSAASVGSVTSTSISATTTSHAAGFVNVVVTNPDTQSGTLTNGFEYRVVSTGAKFYAVTPCRVVDTRSSIDPAVVKRGNFADDETRAYTLSTSTDCPGLPSDAKAWSVNVQLRPLSLESPLIAYPHGITRPGTTTILGYVARWRVNNAIVPAGSGGTFDVYCQYAARVVIDVNGYFK